MLTIPILILAALLRFYNNTSVALWHDEAFSALYIRYPFAEMMHRIGLDVHPPLYYLILRAWTFFTGEGLLSLRFLSIIFGVLTVWAVYLFVKAAFKNRTLALLSALFIAINPFQIQYALEARMYTLGTFLVAWSSYFLARALDLEGETAKKYWLAYALTICAALYTHYYLLFSVGAQGIFILLYFFRHKRLKDLGGAIAAYTGAAILYLPWLPTLLYQIRQVEAQYWIPPMNRWSIPGTFWKMIFGGTGIRNHVLVISSIAVILLIIYFMKRVRNFQKWHVFFGMTIPFITAIILSLRSDIYLDRYFVFASVYFTILLVMAVNALPKFWLKWAVTICIAAAVIFAFYRNWKELDIKNKPGMAAASEIVNLQAQKNDKIIVGSSFIYFTFKYYNETAILPQLISDRPIKDIPHFSGTAILTDNDLILDLNKFAKGQTVWLLWTTGFGGSKPRVPKNWNEQNETKYADSPGFKGDIYITEYKVN